MIAQFNFNNFKCCYYLIYSPHRHSLPVSIALKMIQLKSVFISGEYNDDNCETEIIVSIEYCANVLVDNLSRAFKPEWITHFF